MERQNSTSNVTIVAELQERIVEVKNALEACMNEKCVLQDNFSATRQQINASFHKHMNTLQCRMNWLNAHAETICHLKDGSLDQHIAELELLLSEFRAPSSRRYLELGARKSLMRCSRFEPPCRRL